MQIRPIQLVLHLSIEICVALAPGLRVSGGMASLGQASRSCGFLHRYSSLDVPAASLLRFWALCDQFEILWNFQVSYQRYLRFHWTDFGNILVSFPPRYLESVCQVSGESKRSKFWVWKESSSAAANCGKFKTARIALLILSQAVFATGQCPPHFSVVRNICVNISSALHVESDKYVEYEVTVRHQCVHRRDKITCVVTIRI